MRTPVFFTVIDAPLHTNNSNMSRRYTHLWLVERSLWYLVLINKEFDIVEAEYIVYHARSQCSHGIGHSCRIDPEVDQVSAYIHSSGSHTWGRFLLHGHGSSGNPTTKSPVGLTSRSEEVPSLPVTILRRCCSALQKITAISRNREFGIYPRAKKASTTEIVLVPLDVHMSRCCLTLKELTQCLLKLWHLRKPPPPNWNVVKLDFCAFRAGWDFRIKNKPLIGQKSSLVPLSASWLADANACQRKQEVTTAKTFNKYI